MIPSTLADQCFLVASIMGCIADEEVVSSPKGEIGRGASIMECIADEEVMSKPKGEVGRGRPNFLIPLLYFSDYQILSFFMVFK